MKALILSDLHSNICALEAVLQAESDSEVIYCAGDFVDVGPCPNEVIDLAMRYNMKSVRGNHDQNLLDYYEHEMKTEKRPADQRGWLHHNAHVIEPRALNFLRQLPATITFSLDGIQYGMTHAYRKYDAIQGVFAFDKFIAETFAGDVAIDRLILGHTHRQGICYVEAKKLWLNPGGIGYRTYLEPENTARAAEYMVIIDGEIFFRRCAYDYAAAYEKIARCAGTVSAREINRSCQRVSDSKK